MKIHLSHYKKLILLVGNRNLTSKLKNHTIQMKELYIVEDIRTVKKGHTNLLWNDFNLDKNNNIYSINKLIEKDKIYYRKKILSLGNIYLNKIWRKSKLNFIIDNNFDYFFLSSIFHQSAYHKNSLHLLTVKFLVIRDFIKLRNFSKVYINISDNNFSKLIYKYCISKNIKVEIKYLNKNRFNSIFLKFIKKKNYLKQILFMISKISLKEKKFSAKKDDIIIFDIFIHFSLDKLKKGNYKSSYWNSLVHTIKKNNLKVKWIHLFYPSKTIRFLRDANKITKILNSKSKDTSHLILDNLFSFKSATKALIKYFKIVTIYLIHRKSLIIKKSSSLSEFNNILGPYISDSFMGHKLLRNIFFYECFNNLVNAIDKPKMGIYIMENIDFELILNYLWKKKINSELISFPHSSARFWDLRYFFLNQNNSKKLFPNKVLIHSKDTLDWAENIKISSKDIIPVESLRYEDLILKKNFIKKKIFKNFLVFTDLDETINKAQLKILEKYEDKNFFIKIHQGDSINRANYKNISFIKNFDNNFDDYDCIILSNASGAVFKPYYENLPFLIHSDTRLFNLNPILDLNENLFFYDNSSFERSLRYLLTDNDINKKLHIVDNRNLQWINILKNKDIHKKFDKINFQKLIDN